MRGMLPCLRYVARIHRYGDTPRPVPEGIGAQRHVEPEPVHGLPEGLAVALLATVAVALHLEEVYLSRYDHVQNQYLDDGFLETFV